MLERSARGTAAGPCARSSNCDSSLARKPRTRLRRRRRATRAGGYNEPEWCRRIPSTRDPRNSRFRRNPWRASLPQRIHVFTGSDAAMCGGSTFRMARPPRSVTCVEVAAPGSAVRLLSRPTYKSAVAGPRSKGTHSLPATSRRSARGFAWQGKDDGTGQRSFCQLALRFISPQCAGAPTIHFQNPCKRHSSTSW